MKISYRMVRAVFVFLPTMLATALPAEVATINASRDAFVTEAFPDSNFGGANELVVGRAQSSQWESFVFFDLSEIPETAIINEVELRFDWGAVRQSGTLNLRQPTTSWQEDTVTWEFKPASLSLGIYGLDPTPTDNRVTIPLNNSGTEYIQEIVSGETGNRGFHFVFPGASEGQFFQFETRESGDPPRLRVDFTVPACEPKIGASFDSISIVLPEDDLAFLNNHGEIFNTGCPTSVLAFTISTSAESDAGVCEWLQVDPEAGDIVRPSDLQIGDEHLDVTIDTAGLTPGTYQCTVAIESDAPNQTEPFVIPVNLIVVPRMPIVSVQRDPADSTRIELSFDAVAGIDYQVQSSGTGEDSSFANDGERITGFNGRITVSRQTDSDRAFYRVVASRP